MKSSEFHKILRKVAGTISARVDLTTFMRRMVEHTQILHENRKEQKYENLKNCY